MSYSNQILNKYEHLTASNNFYVTWAFSMAMGHWQIQGINVFSAFSMATAQFITRLPLIWALLLYSLHKWALIWMVGHSSVQPKASKVEYTASYRWLRCLSSWVWTQSQQLMVIITDNKDMCISWNKYFLSIFTCKNLKYFRKLNLLTKIVLKTFLVK